MSRKASAIIDRLGVKEPPIPVKDVAALFNIKVIDYPKFASTISGKIVKGENVTVIGVNPNHSEVRQRFTIAHELGHYLLGHEITDLLEESLEKPLDREKEANTFAAELLMPIEFIKKDIESGIVNIQSLAKRYNVSEQAISIRLLNTGLINKI
ncbi:MAG: ImmA/IrrE family metallo-endopeptidase [bacterium]|nr:ImmA/IrrE family metallo-endopeptidase [bacterium]